MHQNKCKAQQTAWCLQAFAGTPSWVTPITSSVGLHLRLADSGPGVLAGLIGCFALLHRHCLILVEPLHPLRVTSPMINVQTMEWHRTKHHLVVRCRKQCTYSTVSSGWSSYTLLALTLSQAMRRPRLAMSRSWNCTSFSTVDGSAYVNKHETACG